jgi:hypothetical protein
MIKDIHLTLEVKTFSGNSTPATCLNTELARKNLEFPLIVVNGITRRGRERETCTLQLKAKLERLHSARLTRHD